MTEPCDSPPPQSCGVIAGSTKIKNRLIVEKVLDRLKIMLYYIENRLIVEGGIQYEKRRTEKTGTIKDSISYVY